MARTKVTPPRRELRLLLWMLRQNRTHQRTKRTYPHKIKLTLPKQKLANIKKKRKCHQNHTCQTEIYLFQRQERQGILIT